MNDTALATLQRTLSENREAKRKMLARLAEIESESASLRSQLASLDAVIERTEQALLQLLFPVDRAVDRALQNQPTPNGYGLFGSGPTTGFDDPYFTTGVGDGASGGTGETGGDPVLDAELAQLQQQTGNVRFNDFRIPQAATIVLREANRALHVSEIYRRMAEGGFEFRGQHQLISLAVSLSRSKRFRKVAPGTFELNPDYQAGQVA